MKHLAIVLLTLAAAKAADVPYPDNYRSWTHIKSLVLEQGHSLFESFGGIHHLYGNAKAVAGYKSGGTFADGSVIVFDLLEATRADGAVSEGARKVIGVMHKDAKRWSSTGGWGFEAFKGDTRDRAVRENAAKACFACHLAQKDRDFVFSAYRK
jgi:hypothetical protein